MSTDVMKKTVALIDDDDGPIRYYEVALKDAGFDIVRIKDFKEALDFIMKPKPFPDFWIIDVMMPIRDENLMIDGIEAVKLTSLGLGAGLVLYQKLKKEAPNAPALMLTSITTPSLLNHIEQSLMQGDKCEAKLDTLPSDLVKIVSSCIHRNEQGHNQ